MNIVHPPYVTNQYWYGKVNQTAVTAPAWAPVQQMHPCDLQSSMLKGCTPPHGPGSPAFAPLLQTGILLVPGATNAMPYAMHSCVGRCNPNLQTAFTTSSSTLSPPRRR